MYVTMYYINLHCVKFDKQQNVFCQHDLENTNKYSVGGRKEEWWTTM